jgi:hypothetical protein
MSSEEFFYEQQHKKSVKTLISESEGCNCISLSILSLLIIPFTFIIFS